jgi:diketogulonate reductase-like aldo/keto reductase
MAENLSIFDFHLTDDEMAVISGLKAPTDTPKVCPDPHSIP